MALDRATVAPPLNVTTASVAKGSTLRGPWLLGSIDIQDRVESLIAAAVQSELHVAVLGRDRQVWAVGYVGSLSMWCLELRHKNPALQRGIDGSSKRGYAMRAQEEGQKQDMERRKKREGKRRNENCCRLTA